jgi:hypothetical protein
LHGDDVAAEIKDKRQWNIIPEYISLVSAIAPISLIPNVFLQVKDKIQELASASATGTAPNTSPAKNRNKRDTLESLSSSHPTLTDEKLKEIPDAYLQRTAKVVYLFHRRHTMKAAGTLRPMPDNNPNFALFSPMDR